MSARARRIRRQHRNHGKPVGPFNGVLVRYRIVMWVFSRGKPRLRRVDYQWSNDKVYEWNRGVRDWVYMGQPSVRPGDA